MMGFQPGWRAFMLGSLPHTTVAEAWRLVLRYFPEIPSWPQLPRKSPLESMYVQLSERFPGIGLVENALQVDRHKNLNRGLEQLYLAYLENDLSFGQISARYASALEALRDAEFKFEHRPLAIKGQITGPVSWGLTVVDQNQRSILYDQILEDAIGKHLRLKAAWQEQELSRFADQTIMFIDEPYMASLGSSYISLTRHQVIALIEEIYAGLQGLKGIHCCGNADWSIPLDTSTDILSLDAYDYGESLWPYGEQLTSFLQRDGMIAWGIVPASASAQHETAASLVTKLQHHLHALVERGVPEQLLFERGLITPSCALGSLEPSLAQHIMELTAEVSKTMREQYLGGAGRSSASGGARS